MDGEGHNRAAMKLRLFQVDAFTTRRFSGNPAAVCPLEAWIPAAHMQAIAAENNLSETAFFVPRGDDYELRWFTPTTEVDLCGHATLAAAYVIRTCLGAQAPEVRFHTRSGVLSVSRRDRMLAMRFPRIAVEPCPNAPSDLGNGLVAGPETVLAYGAAHGYGNYMAVYGEESEIRGLEPDFRALGQLGRMGVIATAPGDEADFVSRYFAPTFGIDEDPVTGSTHCALTPYWAGRLGKTSLRALQVSARGGELYCDLRSDAVSIAGHAVLYLEGTIEA